MSVAAELTTCCLVQFSDSSASCHSTGDKEVKVQKLSGLSREGGPANHSSPLKSPELAGTAFPFLF